METENEVKFGQYTDEQILEYLKSKETLKPSHRLIKNNKVSDKSYWEFLDECVSETVKDKEIMILL